MKEVKADYDQIPMHYEKALVEFLQVLRRTPSIRMANVERLLLQSQPKLDVERGQISIVRYRDTSLQQFYDHGRFLGDCIECAVQQFNLFQTFTHNLPLSLTPTIFFTKNVKGWNHFMFGLKDQELRDGIMGVAFDNGAKNRIVTIPSRGNVSIAGHDARVTECFDNPNKSWMLGENDLYSLDGIGEGWNLSVEPFTSTIGSFRDLGLSTSDVQLVLSVSKTQPYFDIINSENGQSVGESFPDSDLTKLLKKLHT